MSLKLSFCVSVLFLNVFSENVPDTTGVHRQTASTSAIGFSSDPRLLSGATVEFPAKLVKKGVEGTVEVRVNIDQAGRVEACEITRGFHPQLDSLVKVSLQTARFSPAYESGKAAPATVSMQIMFDLATILAKSGNAAPELGGVVLDRTTGKPIVGAVVNLEVIDSTGDSEMTIGWGRYAGLIGKVPGQTANRGVLSTTADRDGAFAFRFLPACPVRVVVMAQGFEPGHFQEHPRTGVQKSVLYSLDHFIIAVSDSIVVYGYPEHRSEVDIEQQQYASGLTTYLSDMLKSQTVITGIPEAASVMTVRGGSPFDNRYLICGVPFLAPFHFGGHPYADIDGLMISSLKKVTVTVDRIAGRVPEASGIIIEADPGIYHSGDGNKDKRPEVAIDYGTLSQDFLLTMPMSKTNEDYAQIGYSGSKDYYLKFFQLWFGLNNNSDIGVGPPMNMGNLTLTGSKTGRTMQADAFGWFAWDCYASGGDRWTVIPWGMASLSIHPPGRETPQVRYGGSHQYFMDGKRVGNNAFLKQVYLSNGSVSLLSDSLVKREFMVQVDCRVDYENWHGSVVQRDTNGLDTGTSVHGHDIAGHVHGAVERQFGPVGVSSDLLGSVLFDDLPGMPDVIFDAGISGSWKTDRFQAELHAGRVTSRPDVRGLPDSLFRREHLHAWLLSMPLSYNGGRQPMRFSVQPYVRYQDRAPGMDPLLYTWDEKRSTPVLGEGVDISGEVEPLEWLSWNSAFNLSRANRISGDTDGLYEWNVPWTFRSDLHLNYRKKAHVYLKGIATSMAPYYDFTMSRYAALPFYLRWDVNLQYRTERPKHRYLTRYDGYFTIKNATDVRNIRDYYWDTMMKKHPVPMGTLIMELGARFGFRL